jgi:tetratricopeptide (TPR) repeat protein
VAEGQQPSRAPDCSIGAAFLARGDVDRALKSLAGVRAGKGTQGEQNTKGLALLLSGRDAEAIVIFDALVASDPSFVEARFNRGVALLRSKKYDAAAADFGQVMSLQSHPLRGSAAFHRAICDESSGRRSEAIANLKAALAADPDLTDAHLYLGIVLEKQGDCEAAGRQYLEVLSKRPDSLTAMLRFGICAHRKGFEDTAISYLRRVVEAAPASPEAMEAQKYLVMLE